MDNSKPKAIGVLNDLMFTVKIQEAAKRAGLDPVFVKTQENAIERAREKPAVVILDLNYGGLNPLELIAALKADEGTRGVPLIGYVSHVQVDLRQAAQAAGCDVVVARSAFVQGLPDLLGRFLPNELKS